MSERCCSCGGHICPSCGRWLADEVSSRSAGVAKSDVEEFSKIIVQAAGAEMSATDLYAAYKDWCAHREIVPKTATKFGIDLSSLGFEKKHKNTGVFYLNVSAPLAQHGY